MNRIVFKPGNNGFSGRLDNISLRDATNYFQTGNIGNWTFSGFDQLYYNYISWDNVNENILFLNAPATGVSGDILSIRQSISEENLVDGANVNLKFDIKVYYYNNTFIINYI